MPVRLANTPATGTQPLSWDRRHTLLFSGMWARASELVARLVERAALTAAWTPKPTRQIPTDIAR